MIPLNLHNSPVYAITSKKKPPNRSHKEYGSWNRFIGPPSNLPVVPHRWQEPEKCYIIYARPLPIKPGPYFERNWGLSSTRFEIFCPLSCSGWCVERSVLIEEMRVRRRCHCRVKHIFDWGGPDIGAELKWSPFWLRPCMQISIERLEFFQRQRGRFCTEISEFQNVWDLRHHYTL